MLGVEGAVDDQSGLGARTTDQADNGFIVSQRLSAPVLADLAEESMLDGIPLGGPGRIVTNGHPQLVAINQFFLESQLPGVTTCAVAPAVSLDRKRTRLNSSH